MIAHIDMSLETVDNHGERSQTKTDQSHAVAKAEEKKLFFKCNRRTFSFIRPNR